MSQAGVDGILNALAVALRDRTTDPTEEPDKVMTVDEAAHTMGVSRSMVYTLMRRGELGSVMIGSRRLVLVASINLLISGAEPGPATVTAGGQFAARMPTPKARPIRAVTTPVPSDPPTAATAGGPACPLSAPSAVPPLRVVPPPDAELTTGAAPETVLTMDEAAQRLQCGKGRIRAMLRDGRLSQINVGRRVFVSASDVARMSVDSAVG